MVPRIDMVAVEADAPLGEALDALLDAGHSRLPVYEDDVDHVIGLLYAKDLLACFHRGEVDVPLRSVLRPAYFVPLTKNVMALLADMRKHRVHMAIVVDEYGGTAGLVTIEDILEEIVGEIQDEYDAVEIAMVKPVGPDSYLANARVDVYSLGKLLQAELEDEGADTLGGMILSLLGHVPEAGEAVEHQGWRFTVLAVDGRRIDQVRIEPAPARDGDPGAGSRRADGTRADSAQTAAPGALTYLPSDPHNR
jgi:CBS domain containing-hemolysin-like protein